MRSSIIFVAMFALPVAVHGYQSGAPLRNTGGIDGGQDCSSCHSTFAPANSDPRGKVTIENLQPYIPGVAQNLRVVVSHPAAAVWGFQLTARFVTGGGTLKAGSFASSGTDTKVVCDDGSARGSAGPCQSNQQEWIEHSNAPRTTMGAGYAFSFQWTPPPDENGDISFYFSAVAADGNGDASNDRVYTATVRVPLSGQAGCPLTQRPSIRAVVNAGPHSGPFSSNAMVEIYGSNFQPSSHSRTVGAGDLGSGSFPKVLACIGVEIAGVRVPVTYVQQDQINVQAPDLKGATAVSVVVIGNVDKPNELRTGPATYAAQDPAPSFFTLGTTQSIAAQFAGTANVVANLAVIPGARPAKPGEWITLYGTGFGATQPASQPGDIPTAAAPLTRPVAVTIGGTLLPAADVYYAGLSPQSISGLYQFNVRVPQSAPDGDVPVTITVDGQSTQTGATIPVQK